ncbi:MAG: SH3 domain-containing protein [Betaproteobacteria bacterium]
MNCRAWLVAALFLFFPAVYAAESGYTLKPTELKDQPFLDAVTVVTLAEKTQVEIVTRQGAWMQVMTREKQQGWVRMLSVRLGNPNQKPQSSGNLLAAIGIGSRPRPTTTATVTTGVRGFSEEDLAKAAPNPAEVEKMKGFAATAADAQQLAAQGKLEAVRIAYFGADGKPLKVKK